MEEAKENRVHWSMASRAKNSSHVLKTSDACKQGLGDLLNDASLLALATESSSNTRGIASLEAQPWVYAGGGLGNIDECPLQVCLAGGNHRDSLTFASVCVPPECDAPDLLAFDFLANLATIQAQSSVDDKAAESYFSLNKNIAQVNKYLGTGWICGEYVVEWQDMSFVYITAVVLCMALAMRSTLRAIRRSTKKVRTFSTMSSDETGQPESALQLSEQWDEGTQNPLPKTSYDDSSPWNVIRHIKRLVQRRPETSCLDGLKVLSILWIVSGHVMAIQSSSGPGYLNPASFLPPEGITTTVLGQLLFSSRFAVDTFLCISGYLVVYVLSKKKTASSIGVGKLLVFRVLRILPLYMACLGFWMFIAPHLGSGPFWYQWEGLLEPCRRFWWTNLLFVNNFIPFGLPTTESCFYHSWYLATDVQLFFLFAPWLTILYGRSQVAGRRATIFLWVLSVVVTAILAFRRKWSINTFDGAAVVTFDIEGYAKPHVRAQSYLAGMFVAMLPKSTVPRPIFDRMLLYLSLVVLVLMAFITATGAYARRACTFEEWPFINDCGSLWTIQATFLYTAFSRALWSASIAAIIFLCTQRRGHAIGYLLSLPCWTPLAQLSFGAYLIHPIVIFTLQLGGKEKTTFRFETFFMDFISISVVSFMFSLLLSLTIEFPFGELIRPSSPRSRNPPVNAKQNGEPSCEKVALLQKTHLDYGSGKTTVDSI